MKGIRASLRAGKKGERASPHDGRSADCLAKALETRGIDYEYRRNDQIAGASTPREFLVFKVNDHAYYYSSRGILLVADAKGSVSPTTDKNTDKVLSHKNLTNSILRRQEFSVPEGLAIHRECIDEACAYFSALLTTAPHGICVKPTSGRRGSKVYVGLRDLPSFRSAFRAVAKKFDHILIEEVVAGTVHRFFCVAGRVVAIRYGIPASVEGDGEHSVAELLEIKNLERTSNPFVGAIKLTGPALRLLETQGLGLASIPRAGELVSLSRMSNLDQGADIVDATDSVHASYTMLVEQAVQRFPGLILCGADVAIENTSVPATDTNHHFIELNNGPGFEAHHYPSIGRARDVAGEIVDYLMSRG